MVRRSDADGVEVRTAEGPVHVAADELAWDRDARPALEVGGEVEVLVIGRSGAFALGSLKRTDAQDPWRDPERYQVGDEVFGETLAGPAGEVLARLPGGALARVAGEATGSVRLVLAAVCAARRTIEAQVAE